MTVWREWLIIGVLGVLLLGTLVAAASHPAHAEGERLALLIGNSRYEHATPLRNPENDVELIASSLKSAGFRTFIGKNASHQEMSRLVDDFIRAAKSEKRPTLLVYFAGHGVQLADVNYLIPVDARTSNADELRQHSLNATTVLQQLLANDPGLAMLILDACRDNPFEAASRSLRRGLGDLELVAGTTKRAGQLIAFATAPGTTADDGEAGNSPYASALAESIIEPGLPLEGVFREVRRKVVDRTKGQQQPWERVSLFSEFYFVPPASKPKPANEEATFWDLASIVNSAEIYQRYLDRFPKGTYADLAQRKIAAINSDFSYRRKAELFPIFKLAHSSFPSCTNTLHFIFLDRVLGKLREFENRIIYLDVEFPLRWFYCDNSGSGIGYSFVSFLRQPSGDCGLYGFSADGIVSSKTPCSEPDATPAAFVDHKRIFHEGGLIIGNDSDTKLILPSSRNDFYRFTFDAAEGYTEQMRARVSGLGRIHLFEEEEGLFSVIFEPVDPKSLGVSWKFDNTVAAAKTAPDTKLPDFAASAEPVAPSPLQEANFSVLANRAMSGHDIRQSKGVDEAACADQCRSEPRCRAYLYDKWNRWCFLKSGVSETRIDPKYNLGLPAGTPRPTPSSRPREIVFYRGKQFPDAGAYYRASDHRACGQQCLSLPHCVAFTYDRRAGWSAPCKIMGDAGEYFSKSGADSGVVRQNP